MAKKLTYTFVRDHFEKEGYTLLSKEYNHSQTKLKYKCPNGHEHFIKWNDWQQGKRCPYCFKEGYKSFVRCVTPSKNKLTLSYIKESFEVEGYTLLSTEYKNSNTKLVCMCPVGHVYHVKWDNWKQGCRCSECYTLSRKGTPNRLITIDLVRESFESGGYTLLSTEYVNNNTKLDYICPNGHKHSVTWGHWNTSKSRCPHCSNKAKHLIAYIRGVLASIGYKLLSKKYISNKSKLLMVCDSGHKIYMSFYSILLGHRCAVCSSNVTYSIDYIRSELLKEGYVLLTKKYINSKQKLVCLCGRGHKCKIRFNGWQQGRRCSICKGINLSINRTGDKHWNWQGGKSFEGYCPIWKDKEFKLDILERDAYICLNPYCYKNDTVLSVHHIDYDKNNCHPSNLITVCRACNSRANYDRGWHKSWYQAIMYKRYGHVYE